MNSLLRRQRQPHRLHRCRVSHVYRVFSFWSVREVKKWAVLKSSAKIKAVANAWQRAVTGGGPSMEVELSATYDQIIGMFSSEILKSLRTFRARASSMQSLSLSNQTLQRVSGGGWIPSSSALTAHSLHSTSLAATYVFQLPHLSRTRCVVSSVKSSDMVGNTAKPKRKSVHAVARADTIIPCAQMKNIGRKNAVPGRL